MATVYTDGSRLDGPSSLLARLGWAFVVLDNQGMVVAAAAGVPPPWIDSIPGAEAWAILQAITRCGATVRIVSDCKPCVDFIKAGERVATAASRPLARVFRLIFQVLPHDWSPTLIDWMPSHMSTDCIGSVRTINGHPLTVVDIEANALADSFAKYAVHEHRAPEDVREFVQEHNERVRLTAIWIANAAYLVPTTR